MLKNTNALKDHSVTEAAAVAKKSKKSPIFRRNRQNANGHGQIVQDNCVI